MVEMPAEFADQFTIFLGFHGVMVARFFSLRQEATHPFDFKGEGAARMLKAQLSKPNFEASRKPGAGVNWS
jgi:hypothetical protein